MTSVTSVALLKLLTHTNGWLYPGSVRFYWFEFYGNLDGWHYSWRCPEEDFGVMSRKNVNLTVARPVMRVLQDSLQLYWTAQHRSRDFESKLASVYGIHVPAGDKIRLEIINADLWGRATDWCRVKGEDTSCIKRFGGADVNLGHAKHYWVNKYSK